jgi:LDH2 family malate/lactate/ureidoglycolate dehydrogenase
MMVEVLSGPLVGASFCDYETFDKDWGFFILAFDPNLMVDSDYFKENASELANIIRQNGGVVPGDNGRKAQKEIERNGFVEIEDEVAEFFWVAA